MKIIIQGTKKKKKRLKGEERKVNGIPKNFKATKYSDGLIFAAYEAARTGVAETRIPEILQIARMTYLKWKAEHPLFALALKKGKEYHTQEDGTVTFRDYVYKRLDPEVRKVWDDINACEKEKNGVMRVEEILRAKGKKVRQHIFLYALTASNFDASKACKKANVNKKLLDNWKENDLGFAQLLDEIHWHKGNFFESGLIQAAKAGEVGALIFANRTFNKDRGYGIKVEHEVKGTIHHQHSVMDIEQLHLDIETRRKLLDAMEEQEHRQNRLSLGYTPDEPAIDVEFTPKQEKESA